MKTPILSLFLILAAACYANADDAWNIATPPTGIPEKEVSGTIFGKDFKLGKATINKHMLSLESSSKSGNWPDGNLMIFVKLEEPEKEWLITPATDNGCPHIHMRFTKEGQTGTGTLMFTGEYAMRLQLTDNQDGTVDGRIFVSLPDYKKSYLVGTFTAEKK